ncbi:CAP domain-containing protein [Confluentibacter sediminis]|uniref:CAP domain-containing protein n=1 Tax=Confluentibacter sediminis TaxID=2219045 RepID=UPI000DAC224D|nr:CAP domain-containing protein [Confluentibacter sediminis]
MKLLNKLPLVALFAVLSYSCSTDSMDDKSDLITADLVIPATTSFELEILELINDHRLSVGLNPLQNMDLIKSQAFSHTDYMVEAQEVSHDYFYDRSNFLKKNAGAVKVSENVAYGYTSAQSLVNAWLKSEGHKANIEGDFTNFDISAEKATDGKWYYTNIFIKK